MEIIDKLEYIKSLVFQNEESGLIKQFELEVYNDEENTILKAFEVDISNKVAKTYVRRKFRINNKDFWYKLHFNGYICLYLNGVFEYYKFNTNNLNNLKGILICFYTESYMTGIQTIKEGA